MNSSSLKLFFGLLFSTLLVACSTPPIQEQASWEGRFSLTTALKGQQERNTGSFRLSEDSQGYLLLVKGPLGASVASLSEAEDGSVLRISGEEPRIAKNSRTLTQNIIGVPVSLQDIADLLEGNNNLSDKQLQHNGWTIQTEFSENKEIKRITVSKPEEISSPAVKLILIPRKP